MIPSSKRLIQMAGHGRGYPAHSTRLLGQLTAAEKVPWVGDTPATAPPLATDLSPELTRKNVSHAIEKVADWELAQAEPHFNQDWTFAALYTGFMAVPKAANGEKYQQAMLQMAQKFNWQPGPRVANADDAGDRPNLPGALLPLSRSGHDRAHPGTHGCGDGVAR